MDTYTRLDGHPSSCTMRGWARAKRLRSQVIGDKRAADERRVGSIPAAALDRPSIVNVRFTARAGTTYVREGRR